VGIRASFIWLERLSLPSDSPNLWFETGDLAMSSSGDFYLADNIPPLLLPTIGDFGTVETLLL
tara:strand:+ start:67 stop:255 length:189 start_codon:yes stop_codon:yes gene_type:complete